MKTVVARVLERTSLKPWGRRRPACAVASPSCRVAEFGCSRRTRA